MPNMLPPVFEIAEFSIDDVDAAINRLSNSCALSVDVITSYMMKCCKQEVLNVLCYVFNFSVRMKPYPDIWKLGKHHSPVQTG